MRNLKKALSLALASVMVMGMTVVGSNAAFADVDTYDHKEAIDVMQLIDVMVGDQNGNFNPDQKVTRNEMAVVIAKLMNLPLGGNHPFKDVPAWADEYVGALYSHGITGGTSATTYGGSRNITAKEAGLMMMKALGYFTFQGEYGDDWALATVRQANQINLFKDMGVYVDQQLTRNDVAQLTLNTLKSDVVVTKELGGLDVSGNGIIVNQKPFYKHELVLESEDYRGAGRGDAYQQLVEKLYGSDLKLNEANTTDEFGRPASKWTYKSVNSVTSPKAADKVYTAPVKYKDISSDLNATKFAGMKVNGKDTPIDNDLNKKAGQDGDVIEAYLNDKGEMTVVVVSTYYGEVRKIENDGKDSRAVKIGGKTFKTDAFSVGDKVLYTVANGEIQNVALVGAMKTGTVTKIVGDDLYIDGVKVLKNHAATDIESVEAGDKVEYYVDGNGYIVKMDITEDMISLDKVGFVNKAVARSGFDKDSAKVELIMSNGTKKVLEVENRFMQDGEVKDENGEGVNLFNRLVAISEKNGEYTLKLATNAVDSFAKSADWKNSNATFNGKTVDNNTLFVYAITDTKGNVSYESYKGYRNALGIENVVDTANKGQDSVPQYTYKLNRDGVVELVYVAAYTDDLDRSNSVENWIFVKADGDEGMTVMPDNTTYYEYQAVVDGKATTIKMDLTNGLTGNTFGNTYHVDKDGMTEEVKLDKAFEQKNVNDKNHAVKYEYKNGVVILTEENNTKTVLAPSKDITVIEVDGDELTVTTLDALRGGYEVYKSFDWVVKNDNSQVQVLVATIK